jgi:hypothetical protein
MIQGKVNSNLSLSDINSAIPHSKEKRRNKKTPFLSLTLAKDHSCLERLYSPG